MYCAIAGAAQRASYQRATRHIEEARELPLRAGEGQLPQCSTNTAIVTLTSCLVSCGRSDKNCCAARCIQGANTARDGMSYGDPITGGQVVRRRGAARLLRVPRE